MKTKQYAQYSAPDSSPLIEKFINSLMKDGKKLLARRIFSEMLEVIGKREKEKNPLEVFDLALRNIMPNIEVRAKRVGGAVYQIPVEVAPKRQQTLAIRWVLANCRKGRGRPMGDRLANEVLAASKNEGSSIKKREDVHKMAQANKAYAHMARY